MPRDFTYLRKYIILRNDYTNIDNINPKGHGKIEIKGNKGTVRINLENCEVEEQYRIYLLKEERGIVEELDLGRILTDERGRGRTDINVSPRDLESKGFSVDKLDAVVIRRDGDILLGGYIDKGRGAIEKYISSITEKESVETDSIQLESDLEEELEYPEAEEEIYVEEPESSEEPVDYNTKPQEYEEEELSKYFPANVGYGDFVEDEIPVEEYEEIEVEEEVELHEDEEESTQEFKEELLEEPIVEEHQDEDIDHLEIESKPEIDNHEEPTEASDQPFQPKYNQYGNYQSLEYMRRINNRDQMTNYILSVLKFFPQVQPLKTYLHGYTWWRIDDNGSDSHRGFLPYYNYLFSADYKYPFLHNSTTCINQIMKYSHYLFGLYRQGNETKFYVYAVPGRFTVKEHPFKGVTGFNTWYESIDGIGYWIVYIDPMTGKVIYPINPMVPTE